MKQPTHLSWYREKIHEYLSSEELQEIMIRSVAKSWLEIGRTWFWIILAMSVSALFPHPLVIIAAMFIIGGKQLACAIIMHDASHDSLFKSRKWNNIIGNWLGAYPLMVDIQRYRPYHNLHHRATGLDNDPDLSLTKGYPTSNLSMLRKFARDLFGLTGIKGQFGILAMNLGLMEFELGGEVKWIPQRGRRLSEIITTAIKNLAGPITANAIIFIIPWSLGYWWLYLLWIGSLLTTYNFCLRVRSMAEHSMTADRLDPQKNTRTTYANWLERLLFAPLNVNYHAEHHLLMGAPSHNYPKMHQLLLSKGYYKEGELAQGYIEIIKKAIKPKESN